MTEDLSFFSEPQKRSVVVTHGHGAYANTRAALAALDLSGFAGKRVLLKPNAGRYADPGSGVNTDAQVVAAAIDGLRQAGAEVLVGESPITGVQVMKAFDQAGITAVCQERDCPLIDMDARPFVDVTVPEGRVIQSLRVCPEVLEVDAVVSIPVMKMHMHTGATLAVKNMKGCLWRRSKVQLHMLPTLPDCDEKPINVAIADLASVLRPHLAIIDGTVGMEGLGPSAGRAKPLDAVVVGADAFAADAVACALMGFSAQEVPYLRMGAERGYGSIDLEQLTITPDQWRDWADPFARPPQNLEIQFPDVTVWDRHSCSACQSTLLLFLQTYQNVLFDYTPQDQRPINVAIGKGHDNLPEGTLCVGNCTANQKQKGIFVPGCPPVSSEILKALTGSPVGLNDEKETHSDST